MDGMGTVAMQSPSLPSLDAGPGGVSNLYIKGLPNSLDEDALVDIFSRFGDIRSCQILPDGQRAGATNVGYVGLGSPAQAREAIAALNGASTERGVLEVRSTPPAPAASRQQTPCDNLYVRNLPTTWTEQDLRELFSPFGGIQECRILHRGDDLRGAGALVRMSSIEQAAGAIAALNGHTPRGHVGEALTGQPLLVRYADSPEEKARKQARKEQLAQQRLHRSLDLPVLRRESSELRHSSLPSLYARRPGLDLSSSAITSAASYLPEHRLSHEHIPASLDIDSLLSCLGPAPNALLEPHHLNGNGLNGNGLSAGLSHGGLNGGSLACLSPSKGLAPPPPPPPPPPPSGSPAPGCASLYVKNLPPEADKLWLYERFAPHGAVLSVKVLLEEGSSRCRGVGFVNYADAKGALAAIQAVHGAKVADKLLHVSLQTNRRA